MIKSALLSDGMVLQRKSAIKIWGVSEQGSTAQVLFQGAVYSAEAGSDSSWVVEIPPLEAGGPFEMTIKDDSGQKIIQNILVGDVWLLSGQSNMELPIGRVQDLYEAETKYDYDDNIRTFNIERNPIFAEPRLEQEVGKWVSVTPETVMSFSAAGYFFAKELRRTHNVPIGFILNAVGGSPVEAWMSEETLLGIEPQLKDKIVRLKRDGYISDTQKENAAKTDPWYKALSETDKGLQEKFYLQDFDDSAWAEALLPNDFEEIDGGRLKDTRGTLWLRKEIVIPDDYSLDGAKLVLGTLVDGDVTYINGVVVGETGYRYPPRRYTIPSGVLKHGKNVIAVRLISTANTYAYIVEKPYMLKFSNGEISLEGAWKYDLGVVTKKIPDTETVEWGETGLYKGVLYPLRNYAICGTAFYQGESNTKSAETAIKYKRLFAAMISDFRVLFGADMPFLFVQLPNFYPYFGSYRKDCTTSVWSLLREAQRRNLDIPNTGMAAIIDVGEWNDLHPLNKKDVGVRLALVARRVAYNEDIVFSGPLYDGKECFEDRIEVLFSSIGSGLVAYGGELKGFEIRCADGEFVSACAKIDGNKVVVWADGVKMPSEVRYAWFDQPVGVSLYNKEMLPASPFTSEDLFGLK